MKTCPGCGHQNPDDIAACETCGRSLSPDAQQPPAQQPPAAPPPAQQPYYPPPPMPYQSPYMQQPYGATANTSGMLVWSIINIFLCNILGIIATVFTVTAKSSMTQQEFDSKMNTVKILNIIATIGGAIAILFSIVYFVFIVEMLKSLS